MNSNEPMISIEVRHGRLTITDKTIQIDTGPLRSLKRVYEQSRLIVAFLIAALLVFIAGAVVDPAPFTREISLIGLSFVIVAPILSVILTNVRNNIGTATEIRRTAIEHVEYTAGSRLRGPKLRVIVTDGEVTGARPVALSFRQLGGDQQLERALQAFEEAGISVTSTDESTDNAR